MLKRTTEMNTKEASPQRTGLSVIELLVVVSIVGLLVALVLPALHAARESSRRTTCANNLRQLGSAVLQFEQVKGRLPSGGEGTDFSVTPPVTTFETQSALGQAIVYLEESYLNEGIKPELAYNDAAWPANQVAARTAFPSLLCPSNAFRLTDPDGYGQTDYMPVAYTDIDVNLGIKNPLARRNGAFVLGGLPAAKITDGLSRTIAVVEDAGRNWEGFYPKVRSPYADPIFSGGSAVVWDGQKQVSYTQWCAAHSLASQGLSAGDTATPSGNRAMNRWAEPASAGGISGQSNSTPTKAAPAINGNNVPAGGPPNCPWSQIDCGPNEETWSWHPHGSNTLMCDGGVRFVGKTIDPRVLRKMVTPDEQLPYDDAEAP
jgi:prepilin-type processing-associated H-X9-DG protein